MDTCNNEIHSQFHIVVNHTCCNLNILDPSPQSRVLQHHWEKPDGYGGLYSQKVDPTFDKYCCQMDKGSYKVMQSIAFLGHFLKPTS
jgi:hypothetical protein